jgi:hypothetical protein
VETVWLSSAGWTILLSAERLIFGGLGIGRAADDRPLLAV